MDQGPRWIWIMILELIIRIFPVGKCFVLNSLKKHDRMEFTKTRRDSPIISTSWNARIRIIDFVALISLGEVLCMCRSERFFSLYVYLYIYKFLELPVKMLSFTQQGLRDCFSIIHPFRTQWKLIAVHAPVGCVVVDWWSQCCVE